VRSPPPAGRIAGRHPAQRGATTVEFALVVPLLVSILMFSVFLTDLMRVKLKLQEAARYVTWEMTSYLLTDFGSGDHSSAFNEAMRQTTAEARTRYADLNSIEDNAHSGPVFVFEALDVQMQNHEVPFANTSLFTGGRPGGAGALMNQVLNASGTGVNQVLGRWGFNPGGVVQSGVRMSVRNRFLSRQTFDGHSQVDAWGGFDLSSYRLSNRLTMLANGWHLADGGEATIRGKVAGRHSDGSRGGFHTQVKRMTFLGLTDLLGNIPGFNALQRFLPLPDYQGTFVVSHSYRPTQQARNCNLPLHDAKTGLNNLGPGGADLLDAERMRCYDTAPFRDTHAYDESLYRRVFRARGPHFMGCQNAMADDPATYTVYARDEQADKRPCGNGS
jgi:hypothetical protein